MEDQDMEDQFADTDKELARIVEELGVQKSLRRSADA